MKTIFVFLFAIILPTLFARNAVAQNFGEDQFINLYFTFSAKDFSSDDNAYLTVHHVRTSGSVNLGKTVAFKNEPNPKWNNVFNVKYFPGNDPQNQKLFVQIKGIHNPTDIFISLYSYVQNGQKLYVPLTAENYGSSLSLEGTTPFYFSLQVSNVPALDFAWFGIRTGLSDPYVNCYFLSSPGLQQMPGNKFHETTVVRNVRDASWLEEPIEYLNYVKGAGQKFHFEVMDHDHVSRDEIIGETYLDVDTFVKAEGSVSLPLYNLPSSVPEGHNMTILIKWEGWAQLTVP